jgi:hypothetical protein
VVAGAGLAGRFVSDPKANSESGVLGRSRKAPHTHTRSPSCHSLVFLALPDFHNNLVLKDLVTSVLYG